MPTRRMPEPDVALPAPGAVIPDRRRSFRPGQVHDTPSEGGRARAFVSRPHPSTSAALPDHREKMSARTVRNVLQAAAKCGLLALGGRGHASRAEPLMKIRPIEERDRGAIRALIAETGAFEPREVEDAMELVDAALARPGDDEYRPLVLEEEGGTVAAYACFGKDPMTKATYDIHWLAVRADRMGQGYGRRIVAFVAEEVKRLGGRLLVFETSSHESGGGTRELCLETGFSLAARLPDFFDEGDDLLIYIKAVR